MRATPSLPRRAGQPCTAILVACALTACSAGDKHAAPAVEESSTAIKVEVIKSEDGYQLNRGGEPYHIKGAGMDFGDVASFAAHGGNSIRTWRTSSETQTAQDVLDDAHANGVTVALCLPVGAEHWGFDYDDEKAVADQLERMRAEVLKYRDHPALLAWIIGNELNFDYTNSKVYDAVNELSQMIHLLDPNHPTTTTVAGLDAKVVADIDARATDIDFISFQVYGQINILPGFLQETGYKKPFLVTEWGAVGWWEVDKTEWGVPIEATSTEKANTYMNGYRDKLEPLLGQLIGSYVFLWGQKQERTPTWFGVYTEAGEETEAIDMMHRIWTGSWPATRSPVVNAITLDGKTAQQNVTLAVGANYAIVVDVTDADNDAIRYRWEIKPESNATQVGGAFEESIANLDGVIADPAAAATSITPSHPGQYRLFVYAYDDAGHAAHANIPFLVTP